MLYYIRHGQSQANVDKILAGQSIDSPLTRLGEEQAQSAGEELQKLEIKVDLIISSPSIRAFHTAEIVAGIIGYDAADIVLDKRIMEYDMGELTGAPRGSVQSSDLVNAKGSEGAERFHERIVAFIDEYEGSDKNIVFASHAGVGRMLHAIDEGIDPADFYSIESYPNAHVTEIKRKK